MPNLAALQEILSLVPVIPVLVVDDPAPARTIAQALVEGGLPVLEVTLRTAAAWEVIHEMQQVSGAIVGAGTVLTAAQLDRAQQAGCRFAVSPGSPPALLDAATRSDLPLLPGVSSATEAMAAADRGYRFLKFFPAEAAGGIAMLKSLASPLQDLRFCPTGGINAAKARDYLALPNVICVGGSWLTTDPNPAVIRARAAEARAMA